MNDGRQAKALIHCCELLWRCAPLCDDDIKDDAAIDNDLVLLMSNVFLIFWPARSIDFLSGFSVDS